MSGSDRNLPCWCGSGRKRKLCHPGPSQERTRSLTLDFGKPVTLAKVHFDPVLGRVDFVDELGQRPVPVSATVQTEYPREKGPKKTIRIGLDPTKSLYATIEAALISFDRLYVVDTNSRDLLNETVSVCAVFIARLERLDWSLSILRAELAGCFEFRGVSAQNPERLGWATLIDLVRKSPDYDWRWNLGLMSDSELGSHDAINNRQESVYQGQMLPVTFKILYASDQGSDAHLNPIMRKAHKASRDLLGGISRGDIPDVDFRPALERAECTKFRLWSRTTHSRQSQLMTVPAHCPVDSMLRIVQPSPIRRAL